jgi:hypothetical protein
MEASIGGSSLKKYKHLALPDPSLGLRRKSGGGKYFFGVGRHGAEKSEEWRQDMAGSRSS